MGGVEYQVTKVDPTDPETKGMVYQVHKVTEEVAATLGGKVYRARIIKDPSEPTVAGKVYQIVLIDDPDDPTVKGKVYNAILTGGSEAVVVGPAVSPLDLPDAIADSLSYVKAFGGTEQRDIPDNYLQRQFVYMMDGSYLLTDIVPSSDMRIEMDFQTTAMPAVGGSFVGSRDTASAGAGIQLGFNSSTNFTIDGMGSRYISTNTITNNTRYKFTWNNGLATIETGGSVVDTNTFTPSGTNTYPLVINGLNNAGTPGGGQAGIYLYSFRVWNVQGELVINLVPAVQKGTVPVVGFYDTVTDTFKTATAGTFAAGPEHIYSVTPTPDNPIDIISNNGALRARHQSGLPLGYTLLDYVSFDGVSSSGAYVDTGIEFYNQIPNNKIRIKAKAKVYNQSSWQVICGNLGSVSAYTGVNPENKIAYGFGSNDAITDVLNPEVLCVFDLDLVSGTYKVTNTSTGVDIVNITGIVPVASTNVRNILLGGYANSIGTITNNRTKMDFESAEIYNDGVLVSKLIPCKNSSNVVGVYDTVRNVFLTNIVGSTNLVAGSAVSDPVEIYTDGVVETINVHTKNLFDAQNVEIEESTAISPDGSLVTNQGVDTCASYIKVSPNTTYTISGDKLGDPNGESGSVYYFRLATYDANKQFLARSTDSETVSNEYTFTTGANVEYIRFHYVKIGNISTFQLEKGATATAYEPYYNGGTATAEMLLKVGDYQDVQSILDGVVTRKIGIKVLDGTEDWNYSAGWSDTTHKCFYVTPLADIKQQTNSSNECLCSHFEWYSRDDLYNDKTIIGGCISGYLATNPESGRALTLRVSSSIAVDATAFKSWLAAQYAAGTPVIVIYPLAAETTESVAGQTLQVQAGDNTLEITQASIDGLELEAEYEREDV